MFPSTPSLSPLNYPPRVMAFIPPLDVILHPTALLFWVCSLFPPPITLLFWVMEWVWP